MVQRHVEVRVAMQKMMVLIYIYIYMCVCVCVDAKKGCNESLRVLLRTYCVFHNWGLCEICSLL